MTRRIKVRKVCTSANDGTTKVQIRWGEKRKSLENRNARRNEKEKLWKMYQTEGGTVSNN
jgi:hypothetical protein